MKRYKVVGAHIKTLRQDRDAKATQKEFAYEVGVSERQLREIEAGRADVSLAVLDKIAKALKVHREALLVAETSATTGLAALFEDRERIIERFDEDIAHVTMDEGALFKEASQNDQICFHMVGLSLTEEVLEYADELHRLLRAQTRDVRGYRNPAAPDVEISTRKRVRQLLVLLRGNDVWVYTTTHFKRTPESYAVPADDVEVRWIQQLIIGLGLPGEYGETSIHVPIDHGHPFKLTRLIRKSISDTA